jgi:hypothetical protein
MEQFVEILIQQGPLVAVLVGFGIGMYRYFTGQIDKRDETIKLKDEQIQKLNDEVREDAKENLKLLGEFSNLLDKVLTTTQGTESKVVDTIKASATEVKHHIDTKIIELKNK